MPSSKIIYATSNSNANYQTENTPSNFIFNIQEPITLATPGQILSICFKGIFIPGPITRIREFNGTATPEYIKIHLDVLQFQSGTSSFEQCLARIPIKENKEHFFEAPHSKAIPLLTHSISNIHIKLTDENDNEVSIINTRSNPTILKLEISSMSALKQSFSITVSSKDPSTKVTKFICITQSQY